MPLKGGGICKILGFVIMGRDPTEWMRSLMKKIKDKKEYRRAQAVLEKAEGKTHKTIAKEHGVDERTTQRWIATYIKKGVEGLQICRNSRSKSSITDEDKEIILSALFNDPHLFGYLRNTILGV